MYVEKNHFYQMQSQMLVCGLPESDYMKCFFRRVATVDGDETEAWLFWREAAITTTPFGIIYKIHDRETVSYAAKYAPGTIVEHQRTLSLFRAR